jgi:transposase
MRFIREVLRLVFGVGLSLREVERSLSISHVTASGYVARAKEVGLSWPLPEHLDDGALARLLFPRPAPPEIRPIPDWSYVHRELRRKKVTRILMRQVYKDVHPDGYALSRFYKLYNRWAEKLDLVMRQEHRAGEKLFVDFAGQTVPIVDKGTGEILFTAQIFVAVLGASNNTYAFATRTQTLADWIDAHMKAFVFIDGVPEIVVPDNTKTGITKACRYEPDINPTYHAMSAYYGTAVIPAGVRAQGQGQSRERGSSSSSGGSWQPFGTTRSTA